MYGSNQRIILWCKAKGFVCRIAVGNGYFEGILVTFGNEIGSAFFDPNHCYLVDL
jgi:hypothetical protein